MLFVLAGCRSQPAGPVVVTDADRAEARALYGARCAACHGETGGGDGRGGALLVPPPRSFKDAAWQKATPDARLDGVIRYGGAPYGLSPLMPANPDLNDKPATLAALRELVRSFGAP